MPSLAELTRTFADRLDEIHREGGAAVAARLDGASQRVALQLAEAGSDIHAAGLALAEAHRRAIPAFRDPRRSAGRPLPSTEGHTLLAQPAELQALSVLIKAWLFFVRAFCDNAYRLLLADAEDRPAPQGGSMASALNERNPVAKILSTHAPEVPDWFRDLREVRNAMKEGAAFAFSQLDARGLGLTIYDVRAQKHPLPEIDVTPRQTVTFADVVADAGRVLEIIRVLAASPAATP